MLKDKKLTKEDREKMNLLVKHGELEYSWEEIEPVIRELVAHTKGIRLPPPILPTRFPKIAAQAPDGTPTTLEELLAMNDYLLPEEEPLQPSIMDIQASIDLIKPAWIPWWLWERTPLRKMVDKFLKTYAKVNISQKHDTQNTNKKI